MTFRAKPVVKRSRNPWDSGDRRTFLTTLAFALVIVSALLILVVAVSYTWYDSHLAPIASVAGQSITKDQLTDRLKIEGWRLQEQERRIANQVASGRLTDAQAEQARQILASQAQQIQSLALERIIDNRIQANLATAGGCLGQRRRHRREARRGGDDPGRAPPVGHRGRAGGERRRARADAGPDRRGTDEGERRPRGHRGRSQVGGRGQERLDRCRDPRPGR